MKKYLKMTFAALSAIVLNFSCLAKVPLQRSTLLRHPHSGIRTHNNIHDRPLTPLSTREQISLLKRTILTSNVSLAEAIFTGRIGKRDQRYFRTQRERRFFVRMSSRQFEELQILSLYDLRRSVHSNRFMHKLKIFELITSTFFKVAKNKNYAYQTTASRIYFDIKIGNINIPTLGALINFIPAPNNKRAFVKQLLNYAKRDNDIDAYNVIFSALDPSIGDIPALSLSAFKNQPWLQPFIREYLEQALRVESRPSLFLDDMPLDVIKETAPDLYNEKFFIFLKQCITESEYSILLLLPRDENTTANDLPSNDRSLPPKYLNLALEEFANTNYEEEEEEDEEDEEIDRKYILSSVALYTDTSSDLTDVVQTLANIPQEKRKEAFKLIKDANINLYRSILEELLQRLGH